MNVQCVKRKKKTKTKQNKKKKKKPDEQEVSNGMRQKIWSEPVAKI